MRAFKLGHADELGEAFVHRVNRNAGRLQAVPVLERRDVRLVGDAAEEKAVGRPAVFQQRQCLPVKFRDDFRGLGGLGGFLDRLGNGHRLAFAAGIGIGQWPFEPLAAEHDDKPVAFTGFDDDLDVANFFDFLFQDFDLCLAHAGVNATGPAVGHEPFGVERAEVGTRSDVAGFEVNADAERFDNAAADFKFERVVAEQAKVAGTAAGRDAGRDRRHATHRGMFGERVEVGRFGDFERRAEAGGFGGDVTNAIINDERKFGLVRNGETGINFIKIHSARFVALGDTCRQVCAANYRLM